MAPADMEPGYAFASDQGVVSVEVVTHRTQMRRFVDVPFVVHGADDRWSRPVRAFESWIFDERRHPAFEEGYAAYLLARRDGRPIGRLAAYLPNRGAPEGTFGFLCAPDDVDVTAALMHLAEVWLTEEGASAMVGPIDWRAEDGFGVPIGGDAPGLTGRPWQPGYYAEHLESLGLEGDARRQSFRLSTADFAGQPTPAAPTRTDDALRPAHAGRHLDEALVFDGIAAVPDVSGWLRTASVRSAWRAARAAADRAFDTAVVVRCDGDPAVEVPRLAAAAHRAGYRWLVSPWASAATGARPEVELATFRRVFAPDQPIARPLARPVRPRRRRRGQ